MCDWCSPNLTLTDADVVQGNAEIRAVYGDRSHILIVSTYQMCMLDLFNKADSLTFRYVHVESWSVYAVVCCAISCMLFVPLGAVAQTQGDFRGNEHFWARVQAAPAVPDNLKKPDIGER